MLVIMIDDSHLTKRWAVIAQSVWRLAMGWTSGENWEFSSSTPCPGRLLAPPTLLSNGYRGLGVK